MVHRNIPYLIISIICVIISMPIYELHAQALPKKKTTQTTSNTKSNTKSKSQRTPSTSNSVKANSNGNTSNRVKANSNSSNSTTKAITISPADGEINGHGYVDLGLPSGTKWAINNFGEEASMNSGRYCSWNELSENNHSEAYTRIFGATDNTIKKTWGNKWSIPSKAQYEELFSTCSHIWTSFAGISGLLFTGLNGHTLFLPAAGRKLRNNIQGKHTYGSYWTTSFPPQTNNGVPYIIWFDDRHLQITDPAIPEGFLVRLVSL